MSPQQPQAWDGRDEEPSRHWTLATTKRQSETGLFAVECASSCPPPAILIEAKQAGQEGIATLPVLVISMQAV